MNRILALILSMTLIITGCAQNVSPRTNEMPSQSVATSETATENESDNIELEDDFINTMEWSDFKAIIPEFVGLDDPNLLRYVEDNLYSELVGELNSDEYFIENISAVYLSEEYLEELAYNSKKNIYFGFSLSELDAAFEGTRYVFTLGDNNETIVEPFEAYDDAYERIIKNTAMGSGVILICVTVSMVTAGAGLPAVSLIFSAGAKTGALMAFSSGAFSGITASIITGVETHDMDKAIKAGLLDGSKDFKWGAITGVITGGALNALKYAKAMEALKGTALKGITTQEAAAIQMESGYPIHIVKQIHSMKEYKIYKKAGLVTKMVNGKLALVKKINLKFKSELPNKKIVTNLQRMKLGYAPIDPLTGKAYQLHHIGQKADATLAILTEAEHLGNSKILNIIDKASEIDRPAFDITKKAFWKSYAAAFL